MHPRGYVILLGGLTTFTGYTLAWWGWLFIQGYSGPGRSGPGLIDLVVPSRLCKVRGMLAGGPPGKAGAGAPFVSSGPPLSSLAGPPPPGGGINPQGGPANAAAQGGLGPAVPSATIPGSGGQLTTQAAQAIGGRITPG